MAVSSIRYCGNCGTQLDQTTCKVCSNCGTCLIQFTTPLEGGTLAPDIALESASRSAPLVEPARAPAFLICDQVPGHSEIQHHCTLPMAIVPLLPAASVQAEELDHQMANKGWWLYVAGWVLGLVCSPCFGLVIWGLVSAMFYCQPKMQRAAKPRQRRAAQASLITCNAFVVLAFVFGLIWVGLHHREIQGRFHWCHGPCHHHGSRNHTAHTHHGHFLDWVSKLDFEV